MKTLSDGNDEKIVVIRISPYVRQKGELMSGFNDSNEKSLKVCFNTNQNAFGSEKQTEENTQNKLR